jgi:hypothetical protein
MIFALKSTPARKANNIQTGSLKLLGMYVQQKSWPSANKTNDFDVYIFLTNCCLKFTEIPINESHQKTAFAYTTITDKQYLGGNKRSS